RLDLDVELDARAELQDLVQGRHFLAREAAVEPRARIEAAQLGERARPHRPAAVGRPLERRVVDDDGNAVRAQADVELDPVRPETNGLTEGCERVLRCDSGCASMSDDVHAGGL